MKMQKKICQFDLFSMLRIHEHQQKEKNDINNISRQGEKGGGEGRRGGDRDRAQG